MNFSYHKRQGKAWYSPPFYSEPGGYKFCLRIDPNGMLEGKESHLSVWVYVMRGRFDESLKWPFTGNKVEREHFPAKFKFLPFLVSLIYQI